MSKGEGNGECVDDNLVSNTEKKKGHLERMKHGNGIKGRDDESIGLEILITEVFGKINPTDPLILA